ncbi:integrin alpha-2 [Electrophorus electricus]|uniref:integrin alpha-2 n=1 Tax=Electrophorus electricus TaxID=8005 RepID=UPI0015D01131|nr:integrin alpha-2 [Electrophorus electricus]XP_026863983.2 integrin alpha-2 [Electrophorus electricus]XP_026863990.2 integrin alpha-2 [Electrophorus electricus]
MGSINNILLVLLAVQGWAVEQSWGFNVGTAGAKVFSGPALEEFGYTIQQFSNHQGKWLLVGSPWSGYPQNRKGNIYKCEILGPQATCDKLNLQNSVNILDVQNINTNMSLGLTLTRITKNSAFMTCGPLWAQSCGSQFFYPGLCADVSPLFTPQPAFIPALQTCGGPVDIAIVLDGSNSIYPWPDVQKFLHKLLSSLDIGPDKAQVSVMQYSGDLVFEFYLNKYKTRDGMLKVADTMEQKTGQVTNTFAAIDAARKSAFLPEHGGRPGATKVMVVVTDGESADAHLSANVMERCNKDNIIRFGIAILKESADIKKFIEEIESIASNPKEKHVFNVSSEAGLVNIAGTLGDRIFTIEGTGKGEDFQMEMSQVGLSVHQTMKEDVVMLGAAGAYGWSGTVVHKNAQGSKIFPKQAFERILDDKNQMHSALLGYSVTTLIDSSSEYYVGGAPRSNHTGQVVVYVLNSQWQPRIIDSQRGEQIGSYFGSVICPLDVNRDGITDLLLVGAPMYMSDQKKEVGKVYVFSITKGILESQGSLEGASPLVNARFGMAITAVPDLNLDGFTDVVIGAPLEGNNQGAIYIYNGDNKTIRKQSSQKILGTKLDPVLKFFGRSLDGSGDINGDSIPDVSVGCYGKVFQLWSRGIAVVTAKVTFTPDKISILSKTCSFSGRMVSCFSAKVCFSATFRPANPFSPADIKYNLTLDADLQSSRVSSRGQFGNLERVAQGDISVTTKETCEDHQVYVQESPDLVNSIAVRVDIRLQNPDSSPVLDVFSPTAWQFFIPFSKDCGVDEVCYCDLVLSAESQPRSGSTPIVVTYTEKRLSFTVTVMNRRENSYNTRVSTHYSSNLFYASVTPPRDGTEVKCTSAKDAEILTCQVGYPALRTDQSVTFEINFDFNFGHLQKEVSVVFEAQSDSTEETPADNKETVLIPIQYNSGIILSREANMNVYLLDKLEVVPTKMKTFNDIGPEFTFSLKVSGGIFPVKLAYLDVSFPITSKLGNPLIYVTSVTTAPARDVQCETGALIDPFKIKDKEYTASFKPESFRGIQELNCERAACKQVKCVLKGINVKSLSYVNVTAWIWNGTFSMADFLSVDLTVNAKIETSQPDMILIYHKDVKVNVTVSKPGAKADIPVGVIVGSVIGGLLLLALLVVALWKLGFFKRKFEHLQSGQDTAERQGLQDNQLTSTDPESS